MRLLSARVTLLEALVLPRLHKIAALTTHSTLSQPCLSKTITLFHHLNCHQQGPSYDTASTDTPRPFAQGSIIYQNNEQAMGSRPWSYEPVCTDRLESLGNEMLCVFTSIQFLGGRGISIITTPSVAEDLTTLPAFRRDYFHDLHESIYNATLIRNTEVLGKGKALEAQLDVKNGGLVSLDAPVLLVAAINMGALPLLEYEELVRVAVSRLPKRTQQSLSNLSTRLGGPSLFLTGLLITNAGYTVQYQGIEHNALFHELGLVNHDCAPNSYHRLDPSTLVLSLTAARDISRGEEITITYFDQSYPIFHFQPVAIRQHTIERFMKMTCQCSRCHEESSDATTNAIAKLQGTLPMEWDSRHILTVKKAHELINMYHKEGLNAFMDIAYGFAALAHNAVGDTTAARIYAIRALRVLNNSWGFEIQNASKLTWRNLVDSPQTHWSWRWMLN